jgi:hypothetical protein
MIELSYKEAHEFVSKNSQKGYYWDGYSIVRWVPNANGFSMKNGMFKNNQWGISFISPVTTNGTWKVKSV